MKNIVFDFHGVIHNPSRGGVDSEILRIIKTLYKKDVPLYIFTNSPIQALKRRDQDGLFLKYFQEVVQQYSKPHSQSFEELFSRLECEPSEIILIDDSTNVIKEAQGYGVVAIKYEGASELKKKLEELLDISLDSDV